jgi:hypothetical protein
MSSTRRLILLALVVFVGLNLYHAVSPWVWTGQLRLPLGTPAKLVSFRCGAPWGSGYVRGPAGLSLTSAPCTPRRVLQVMTALDVLVGVFAIAVLVTRGRGRSVAAGG